MLYIIEISLITIGIIVIILSCTLGKNENEHKSMDVEELISNELRKLSFPIQFSKQDLDKVQLEVDKAVNRSLPKVMEDAESKISKISNEKVMMISEYVDVVLKDIDKNHQEVMFLYTMLNNKEKELKKTVNSINDMEIDVPIPQKEDVVLEKEKVILQAKNLSDKIKENQIEEVISNNNNDNILALFTKGYKDVDIAKKLNLGIGEVKLVIDLFQRTKS